MLIDGVLGFWEAVITISRRRGIPRVTFAAPCPRFIKLGQRFRILGLTHQQSGTYLVSFGWMALQHCSYGTVSGNYANIVLLTPATLGVLQLHLDRLDCAYT